MRPVGEPESDGIRQGELVLDGMWNYFPMQFEDHAILYICHERDDGSRPLVQAERVWSDPTRPVEDLGRPEHEHRLRPGSRVITESVIRLPEAGIEIECASVLPNFVSIGTGYGIDADWKHGRYQGPEPVTQGLVLSVDEVEGIAAVRHRGPRRPVPLRRPGGLRPARARVLRPLPPLRPGRRGDGGTRRLTVGQPHRSPGRGGRRLVRTWRMPDAYRTLADRLQAAFDRLQPGADPVLRPSERTDYQANGALALGKRLGRPPREVAEEVVAAARLDDLCDQVVVSGPGFINLHLSTGFVAGQLAEMAGDERLGVRRGRPAAGGGRLLGPQRGQGDARRPPAGHRHR